MRGGFTPRSAHVNPFTSSGVDVSDFLFLSLHARGTEGRRRLVYRPPRHRVRMWRQSGPLPRTSDKVYGGDRRHPANHDGYRAAPGQPPRHFAFVHRGEGAPTTAGGGLHAEMTDLCTPTRFSDHPHLPKSPNTPPGNNKTGRARWEAGQREGATERAAREAI